MLCLLSYLYVLCVGLLSPIGPTTVQYNTSDTVLLQLQPSPGTTYEPSHGTTMELKLSLDPITITITTVPFH